MEYCNKFKSGKSTFGKKCCYKHEVDPDVFKDSVFKDSVFKDSMFKDSVFKDSVFKDPVFKDSVFKDSVFKNPDGVAIDEKNRKIMMKCFTRI